MLPADGVGSMGGLVFDGRAAAFAEPIFQALEDDEEPGNEEDGENGGGDHTAEHRRSQRLLAGRTRTSREYQRNYTHDERERSHQDRPETQPGSMEGRVDHGFALFAEIASKLHNQNGVLTGQRDD